MTLECDEWEIWHAYTSYLDSTEIDLRKIAYRLVSTGMAMCTVASDGHTVWMSKGTVTTGSTTIEGEPFDESVDIRLSLDEEEAERPEGFASEGWAQAAHFLVSESRVLTEAATLLPLHLRAVLGKFLLTSAPSDNTRSQLSLYPILNVYETGVLLLEFRIVGPDSTTSLAEFINDGVNLFVQKFDTVQVSPGFSAFATRAYYQSDCQAGIFRRLELMRNQARHELAVRQRTERHADASFAFDMAPLSGGRDSIGSLATTIFNTIAFMVGRPRMGLSFLFCGQRPSVRVGKFWSGRPHIYLVRFRDQCQTASENEERHGGDFARIVCRAPALDEGTARKSLPKDARLFQDFSAYITSAASLWVWSLSGLSGRKLQMDPNRGNLIYQRQVLVEAIEYGYMLHRSLYHRIETFSSTEKVLAVRKEILRLRHNMREASHSGEVRELLEYGWEKFGLPRLLADIDEGLRIRESVTNADDARRTARIGWALTVVFGFVAVPALADQVVKPLWKLTSMPQFGDESLMAVVSDGVAVVLVVLFLLLALSALSRSEK